jgi:hypothetical protein
MLERTPSKIVWGTRQNKLFDCTPNVFLGCHPIVFRQSRIAPVWQVLRMDLLSRLEERGMAWAPAAVTPKKQGCPWMTGSKWLNSQLVGK